MTAYESPDLPEQFYDPDTGAAVFARDEDGTRISWQLHTPGEGVHCGIIMGPPESGRSNALNLLLAAALQSTLYVPWVADPLGRNSHRFKAWMPAIDWMATTGSETTKLLQAGARVVEARLADGPYRDPCDERPGILILVDECEYAFRTGMAARAAETIATRGQRAAVGLVVTCADGDLTTTFGGRRALREAMAHAPNRVGMGLGGGMNLLRNLETPDPGTDSR